MLHEGQNYNGLDNYIKYHGENKTISLSNKNRFRKDRKRVQGNRDTKHQTW